MRKFKVLQVLNRANIAGSERHVLLLLKYLNKDLFDPTVVCFSEGPLLALLEKQGIKTRPLKRTQLFDISITKQLYSLMNKNKFDLLHSHSGPFACVVGKLARVPNIVETRHGLVINYDALNHVSLIKTLFNRYKAKISDLTITVTSADKKILMEKFGIPRYKIRNIANGVDIQAIQMHKRNANQIKKNLNIESSYKIIGSVARFTEQKGLKYFIQSMKYITAKISNTKFLIVGDGVLKDYLVSLANQSGLSQDLILTGYRDDAISIMSIFDVFVLPSLWEGMPYTILEAMALKTPVVTTNVFGNREIVIDGKTGFLVPPRNSLAIAHAVINLLMNEDKALKMGESGFNRIEKLFSAKKMTEKIEKTYLELLNGKKY